MMRRLLVGAALSLGIACSWTAAAGTYTEQLGQCLTNAASQDDRTQLMRWMFSAMALHPAISSMANISAEQRAEIDKTAGALFQRLVTQDCRQPVIDAIKNEGQTALQEGFKTLGQIAAGGLMTAPEVSAGMAGLAANLDQNALAALFKEAGVGQ